MNHLGYANYVATVRQIECLYQGIAGGRLIRSSSRIVLVYESSRFETLNQLLSSVRTDV